MNDPTTHYFDHGDEGAAIVRRQIVGPTMDAIAELRNTGMTGTKDVKYVGSAPMVLVEAYCNRRGITLAEFTRNPEHARAFLNDPDHADCRVWRGRV